MTLSFQEEIALNAAIMAIKRERSTSLNSMFSGAQLAPKSRLQDAKTLANEAKDCKKKIEAVPGLAIPNLALPALNVNIFKGIDLRSLVDFRIPALPGIDLSWIPDIRLGDLPGFNLPQVRLNLKGILKFKDLLPNISLRALAYALAVKWPDINFPSLIWDLSKLLNLNFDFTFPRLKLVYPDFLSIDLDINLPEINLPEINFPALLKVPGFDKVLRLLFDLFDELDLNVIIEELGAEFLVDFFSSALPLVGQVKAGAQAASNWGTSANDWHKATQIKVHREFVLPGNARDACDAVAVLLRNSRDEHATLATIQTTQLAVSTAGLFTDLGGVTGPAVAATAALAKTCHKVLIMGARYKEVKKINLMLKSTPVGNLRSNIFNVSPLLGCYYLANNTTSNVLNVLSSNIIEDADWMSNADLYKRNHLDPLIKESQRFILESRYVLTPIQQNKGMYVALGFSEKIKQGASLYVKKKLGMKVGGSIPTHKYIG
jgi:hypothetical protein